jgi:hypothetical protein
MPLVTSGVGGTGNRPVLLPLAAGRDAQFSLETLAPHIKKYADQYGVRPEVMAAIVEQESSYINYAVHRDGTGHGLIGLDDHGMLPDFERWSGLRVGRGRHAQTIPPDKQIEFLARTLAAYQRDLGDEMSAVRAWHAGVGGRDRANGIEYQSLIENKIPGVTRAVATTSSAKPPAVASAFEPGGKRPVDLGQDEPGTPVAGSVDFENG